MTASRVRSISPTVADELTRKALSVRFADIEADRNPTNPYEGLGELEEITELR